MKKYVSGVPNERVQIDIVGPLIETHRLNKFLIVLTDCFTKWARAYAVPRATATAVADTVLDWVSQFGVMQILHSDQGKQFESIVISELCQKLGILKPRATSYYPASDGQVERLNRTLIEMLSKYAEENHRRWDDHLPLVLLAYNSSVHDSTSLSPAMMTYARELDLPADLTCRVRNTRLSKLPHRRSMCGTLRSKWKKSINWPVIISLKAMTHKDAAMTSNSTNTIIKWGT